MEGGGEGKSTLHLRLTHNLHNTLKLCPSEKYAPPPALIENGVPSLWPNTVCPICNYIIGGGVGEGGNSAQGFPVLVLNDAAVNT